MSLARWQSEHGSPITTADLIEQRRKRVRSFRSIEHAVLSYNSTTGLLKIGGVAKARRADLAELFAGKILGKPEFFAGDDAQGTRLPRLSIPHAPVSGGSCQGRNLRAAGVGVRSSRVLEFKRRDEDFFSED